MAPCRCKDLKVKTKEVKIPHLTNVNKKMEVWGLGGLFAVDWSQIHEDLLEEPSGHSVQKVTFPKYEYRGKPGAWISDVWREVYHLPKASPGGYVMKGKVQFTELQFLKLVKRDKGQSKFGVFLEQVKALGIYNEATCLGMYLTHLYSHFHEMDNEQKEVSPG
ncbi:hypothetical protein R1flu_018812 [Riccia fluitans]|uniref:Uncharacterized protein n=1 Tax=Riccia fluitans TaxID=41844 RepID=A0ABD1ZGX6_9MARC